MLSQNSSTQFFTLLYEYGSILNRNRQARLYGKTALLGLVVPTTFSIYIDSPASSSSVYTMSSACVKDNYEIKKFIKRNRVNLYMYSYELQELVGLTMYSMIVDHVIRNRHYDLNRVDWSRFYYSKDEWGELLKCPDATRRLLRQRKNVKKLSLSANISLPQSAGYEELVYYYYYTNVFRYLHNKCYYNHR
ncbi:hypothetical protein CCFV1_ORF098 [Cotesia congregata filamentous virus 1]|uniref:Uncharacterized protein n=1 Tax=Cotesia congregata filamentous virus 1 TaxID=3064291 RepID=A0ABC8QJS3_9VIRU|nr:hypothetical protein CCFV1_ORF098 [Cotesia congregata filamentous virus 1]